MSQFIKQHKTNGDTIHLHNTIIGLTANCVKTSHIEPEGGRVSCQKQAHAIVISGLYRSLEIIVLEPTAQDELMYKSGDIFAATGEVTAYYNENENERCTPLMFYLIAKSLIKLEDYDATHKNDLKLLCARYSGLFRSIHSGRYLSLGIAKFPCHLNRVEVQLQSDSVVVSKVDLLIPKVIGIGFRGRILSGQYYGFEISVYKSFYKPVIYPFKSRKPLKYKMNVEVTGLLFDYHIDFGDEGLMTTISYKSPRAPAYFLLRAKIISGVI